LIILIPGIDKVRSVRLHLLPIRFCRTLTSSHTVSVTLEIRAGDTVKLYVSWRCRLQLVGNSSAGVE